jgi:hypothetical protein
MTKEERNEIVKACKWFANNYRQIGSDPSVEGTRRAMTWCAQFLTDIEKLDGAPATIENVLLMASQDVEEIDD